MALEEASVETGSEVKVDVKLLSKPDLQDFLQRRGAVEHSRLMTKMVVEGYEAYAIALRERYEIVGLFSVDVQTGQIILKPEPAEVAPPASLEATDVESVEAGGE